MVLGGCFKKFFVVFLFLACCCKVACCESLTIDQKYAVFHHYISSAQLTEDIYCFLNSRVFEIYFNLEFAQNTQDVKLYYDSVIRDFVTKNINPCGCHHDSECRYLFSDRFRMLKRLFHAENYGFLLYCKNRLTNSMVNQSFDQGNILELYFRISQEFEF